MSSKKLSIAVLGSTGSIGRTALKIIDQYSHLFSVDLLCCNKNTKLIKKQINKFLPKIVIINNIKTFNIIKSIKFKKKIKFLNNFNNLKTKYDKTILAISSIHGIDYGFHFIKYSHEMLIANKETIVCGGKFFLQKAKKFKCNIIPIDSEHYSISTILRNIKLNELDKIYLTASGGPFINSNLKKISKVSVSEALKHPKWKMGKKISIDSATMANKALEVMEASILFDIIPDKIKIKIHPESKVHAAIVLKNGLVHLVAHNTSMEIPIRNTLLDNNYNLNIVDNFFFNKKRFHFSFDEINLKKFKNINSGYAALKFGPRGCIYFNVINDYLVNLYLNKKIFFYEISHKLNKLISNKKVIKNLKKKINSVNDIYETISEAKSYVKNN